MYIVRIYCLLPPLIAIRYATFSQRNRLFFYCSAPMLGITYPSTSWSDSTGSYFKNWLTSRNQDKHKLNHMLLDFTKPPKNYKSIDHIPEDTKEKKHRSLDRIKSHFTKRPSTKQKIKRVSEGDASAINSSSTSRTVAIEIPNSQDYFPSDFNPSPRSNNSAASANSDVVPCSGYLPMAPSSSSHSDYIMLVGNRGRTASCSAADERNGYVVMSPPKTSLDSIPLSGICSTSNEGYLDMSPGLNVSADSSSSSGSLNSRLKKTSNTISQKSLELPSPQEETEESSYIYLNEPNFKERKKSKRKFGRESKKRVRDTGSSDSGVDKSRGGLVGLASFLSRSRSQYSSGTKTPLSPSGSPLPKASRSSNNSIGSSVASSASKNCVSPPGAQSTGAGYTNAMSGNVISKDPIESVTSHCHCSNEPAGHFPRNHSSKELTSLVNNTAVEMLKHQKRSSGCYGMSSVDVCNSCNRPLPLSHCDFRERGPHINDAQNSYVNVSVPATDCSNVTHSCKHFCCNTSRLPCCRLGFEKLGQIDNLRHYHEPELDNRNIRILPNSSQQSSTYINMCPNSAKDRMLLQAQVDKLPQPPQHVSTKKTNTSILASELDTGKKILNTDHIVEDTSDYIDMSVGATPSESLSSKCTPTNNTKESVVVKRPSLPPLVLTERSDPTLPLGRLSLMDNTAASSNNCDSNERCRSHSGPGAPEASSLGGPGCKDSSTNTTMSENKDGDSRALSACSSPISYSPPTSPSLASSSKSSLSEGGLSSASSTCTVVNVGLRLQQHRKSHGSGGSNSTTSSVDTQTTSTLRTAIISISPSLMSNLSSPTSSAAIMSQQTRNVGTVDTDTSGLGNSVQSCSSLQTGVTVCGNIGVDNNKNTGALSDDLNSSTGNVATTAKEIQLLDTKKRTQSASDPATSSISRESLLSLGGNGALSAATPLCMNSLDKPSKSQPSLSKDSSDCLNCTDIDFKKSVSLRNVCVLQDAPRN